MCASEETEVSVLTVKITIWHPQLNPKLRLTRTEYIYGIKNHPGMCW